MQIGTFWVKLVFLSIIKESGLASFVFNAHQPHIWSSSNISDLMRNRSPLLLYNLAALYLFWYRSTFGRSHDSIFHVRFHMEVL